jgi:hypothetical protein
MINIGLANVRRSDREVLLRVWCVLLWWLQPVVLMMNLKIATTHQLATQKQAPPTPPYMYVGMSVSL